MTVLGNCSNPLKSNFTEYKYVEKIFKNLRHKLNRTEDYDMIDLKTNVLICGHSVGNDVVGSASWPRISTKFDRVQEQER